MVGAQEGGLGGCRKQEERHRVNAPGTNPSVPRTRATLVLDSCFCVPVLPPANMAQQTPRSFCGRPWESKHASLTRPHDVPVPLTPGRPGSRTAASPRHDSGGIKLELSKKRGPRQSLSAGDLTQQRPESQVKWAGSAPEAPPFQWEGPKLALPVTWI